MKITRAVGRRLKFLVDVPTWMGWGELKFHARNIKDIVRVGFKPQLSTRHESFEEAVARLHLSEEDLDKLVRHFFWTMCFYLGLAVCLLGYTFFLFLEAHLAAGLLGLVVTGLSLCLAFRESFMRFQIQQKRLGCTVQDWMNQFK